MQATGLRRATKLAAAAIGGVVAWQAWQRWRLARADRASQAGDRASGLASTVGVAPIDPEPTTQIAGEGIDPDADPSAPPRLDDVIGAGVRGRATT